MEFTYLPGLGLSEEQLKTFHKYRDFLLEWNTKVNLTAITDPEEVEIKHFLDSLLLKQCRLWQAAEGQLFRGAGNNAGVQSANVSSVRVADVGGGAGFPGIPLKIMDGSITLDTFEASEKRVVFLQALAEALAFEGVRAVHLRAEEAGRDPLYRESYDRVVSRGVAAMPVLLEYCLPLLKVGGYMAAYKGPAGPEEAVAGKKAAALLGGKLEETFNATLPEGQGERCILIYRKVKPTPKKYPRRPGVPAKQPI